MNNRVGSAVDNTIHMLARLRSEFSDTGCYKSAVRNAICGVGPALIATTVILSVAFLSFLLSQMAIMASFGVLLSTAILVALLADLFLLPALVLWLKPFGPEVAHAR